MKALIPALLLLIGGCAINIPPLDVEHTAMYYTTRDGLHKALRKAYPYRPPPSRYVAGFFVPATANKVCEIHILFSAYPEQTACSVRHEHRHCIDLYWHPGPNSDCDTNGRGLSINGDWSY